MADWKDRLGVLYSTNPDFEYTTEQVEEPDTLEPARQELRISLSKKQRGGKEVTLITGFVGREEDLAELGRLLRQRCGVGARSSSRATSAPSSAASSPPSAIPVPRAKALHSPLGTQYI